MLAALMRVLQGNAIAFGQNVHHPPCTALLPRLLRTALTLNCPVQLRSVALRTATRTQVRLLAVWTLCCWLRCVSCTDNDYTSYAGEHGGGPGDARAASSAGQDSDDVQRSASWTSHLDCVPSTVHVSRVRRERAWHRCLTRS